MSSQLLSKHKKILFLNLNGGFPASKASMIRQSGWFGRQAFAKARKIIQ